jgi:periplasmic divalent cation tolerance protein
MTTVPDADAAETIAARLIAECHAACVSIGSPVRSLYHWQGKTETSVEVPLYIKTTAVAYAPVESTLRALHPYELPEIIAIPVTAGLPAYLDWIASSCNRSNDATRA